MNLISKKQRLLALAGTLALLSTNASAHRVWVKPNTTVVSGDEAWVTFDAAIANDIFNPDHYAYPLEQLTAIAPGGDEISVQNAAKLKYRSVFDLHMQQEGTYRVVNSSRSLMASWEDENGDRVRWPERGKTGTKEALMAAVPMDAKGLNVVDYSRRLETFVTLGAPSDISESDDATGLTMSFLGHPNDLYTAEPNELTFTFDGQPAKGTSVTLVRENARYRDTNTAETYTADKSGKVEITFDKPGMYWLEATYEDKNAQPPASERRGNYVVVLEVLPL
ncbi:DUF4198 domain-containing protein [Salinimonas chungwhensis]|uniref:DUF4198 domain-containing protein n=1 Tax=Salinimonas chungwhensis TaxID=265425 RepID=UPI0003722D45|nr:DUF4198 domain-containing protein [Salinimonas chungwhensis]